jgi:hypothetical protein
MVARVLFRRLAGPEGTVVSKDVFTKWWSARGMLSSPPIKRVYEVLRKEGQDVSAGTMQRGRSKMRSVHKQVLMRRGRMQQGLAQG